MARKPKTEYRIRCSGKGKPWHMQNQNRQHEHGKQTLDQAVTDADTLTQSQLTPVMVECAPWIVESRTITQWNVQEVGQRAGSQSQAELGDKVGAELGDKVGVVDDA